MEIQRPLDRCFYQQGYNYVDSVPSGEVKMGGGCQASSLLMSIRLATENPDWSMDAIEAKAKELDLIFYDRGYADRISYVSIPIIAASLLPNFKVSTQVEIAKENIKEESTNIFGREFNKRYLNMPSLGNLTTEYGVKKYDQVKNMIDVLKSGGLVIPLVHPNTLFETDNPNTKDFLHAIVLTGFNDERQTISVIDPNPGFSSIPDFARRKNEGKLKIPSDRIHSIENANRVASKHHPKKSVIYEITPLLLEQSLRSVHTTIISK